MFDKKLKLIALLLLCLLGNAVTAADQPDEIEVVFKTSMGDFTVAIYPKKAPVTVDNFLSYVDSGFYNETIFHRAISGFLVQGGGFKKSMQPKKAGPAIENESLNGLKNVRGSIAMERQREPDTARSQFYINLANNDVLDPRGSQFGYTVFGRVTKGMEIIDAMSQVATKTYGPFEDVPKKEIVVFSAERKSLQADKAKLAEAKQLKPKQNQTEFVAGQHYEVLKKPQPTKDKSKIEVIEFFSYGCPHCYSFESAIHAWKKQQATDVSFRQSPTIWNGLMTLFATTFYTAQAQPNAEKLHSAIFDAVVVDGVPLISEGMIGGFFEKQGIPNEQFSASFDSAEVLQQVKAAEANTIGYKVNSVPQLVVNGKYRITAELAGSQPTMIDVLNFLVEKERRARQ